MKKDSVQDKILITFFYILTGGFAIICLIPLWVMLVASFTNEHALLSGGYKLYIPKFDLTAYKMIFESGSILGSYFITILTTLVGTLLTIMLTSSFAYPLSVKTLKYRNKLSIFAYFTMIFSGGLVPTYILYVRYLHINNSIWVLIVPGALNAFNMFLMKNYFASIPESLSESAKIDGANDVYIYFRIILPLSAPILATIGLFAAMGYWNAWFNVLMYVNNPKLYTLQYLIMRLQRAVDFLNSELGSKSHVTQQPPGYTIRMATAMISIGPIILLYPFLQKYFIKGIMIGSVKG